MTEDEWLAQVHYRRAPRVCVDCRHYEGDCEGAGYCAHPRAEKALDEDGFVHVVAEGTCDLFQAVAR